MKFDELFVTIDTLKMIENYQPVFIKTLLESIDYQATREKIISNLIEFNQDEDKDWGQIFWDVINEVLGKKKNLIEYTQQTKTLRLLVDEELSNEQKLALIELCDKKILEINSKNQNSIDPVMFQKLHQKFLEDMKIEAKKMSVEPPNDEFTNFQHPYFLAEEVKYKREAAEKAQKALSLEQWDKWKSEPTKIFEAVKNACQQKIHDNLITWQYLAKGKNPSIFHPSNDELINKLGIQFYDFFKGSTDFPTRLDNLIQFLQDNSIPAASQVLAYLSFILDPEQYIPIRETEFKNLAVYYKCYRTSTQKFSWEKYSVFLDMLEGVKTLLAQQYDRPDTIEAHSYLWCASSLLSKTQSKKYWLVIPGEDGIDWENQKEKGTVGIGFVNGDLLRFFKQDGTYIKDNSKKEFGDALRARENVPETKAPNHMSQIQWFMQIKKGEKIVAYFNSTIRGIGEVIGDYELRENERYRHTKKVKWYDLTERKVPASVLVLQPAAMTVQEFPKHWRKWFFNEEDPGISTIMDNEDKKLHDITELLESKKQIVLYGPPGTGKTYFAKQLALHILGKNPKKEIEKQFETLKEDGKVNLIQFHPSYSYEDFVQGIKPKNENGQITYEVRDGIFKKMCESLEETDETGFEEHLFASVEQYEEIKSPFLDKEIGIDVGQPGINKTDNKKFKKIFYKIQSQGQEIKLNHIDSEFPKPDNYFILREKSGADGEAKTYGDKTGIEYHFRPGIPGSTQLPDALADGKRVPFVYYDRKRDGFFGIGVLKGLRVEKQPLGPHPKKVLIIDEINRGNLSKIFGELIYALEYRDEFIDLQYKEFDENAKGTLKIPKNLLIIGTMNTADRSIVLFDTAMRRRFAFVPMMPDYKYVLEKLGISQENMEDEIKKKLQDAATEQKVKDNLLSVLAVYKINSKLTTDEVLRLGRERQIGQSYLINLIDEKISFINLWKYEIIPLLEEYYSSKIERLVELVGDIVDITTGITDFDEMKLRDVLNDLVGQ